MKAPLIRCLALLALPVAGAFADTQAIDFDSHMPQRRKAAEVPEFSATLFSRGYNTRSRTSDDALVKATLAKVEKLVVNGLIWHEDPSRRAVLAGDHVLRAGARVPEAMVSDSTIFQVKSILMDKVILEADVTGANPLDASEVTKVSVDLALALRDQGGKSRPRS